MALCLGSGAQAEALLLYIGWDQDIPMACLDCGPYTSGSICNSLGSGDPRRWYSVFNPDGMFGDKDSIASPWNAESLSEWVPVVVDADGKFQGYFTINYNRPDAYDGARALAGLFETSGGDLEVFRSLLCQ